MPGYSHLLDEERDQIAALKAAGRSIGASAKAVGRAKSTVSREVRRNALPRGRYSPLYAAGAYQRRRRRDAVLERDRRLRGFVVDGRAARGHWEGDRIIGKRARPVLVLHAGQSLERLMWRRVWRRDSWATSKRRGTPWRRTVARGP